MGTIVAIAASKAGDISQDLKTGWLVGATPARQQLGQLIGAGVLVAALVALGFAPKGRPPLVAGVPGEVLNFVVLLAVCAFLVRAARAGDGEA